MKTEEPETPSWESIIRVALQGAMSGMRTTLPGKVTAYDAARQMASVQVMVQDVELDELGASRAVNVPEVHSVPVMFLGPARGRITWPVAVGDPCVLWFASSSLDQWLQRRATRPVDPRDARHHDLNDCIAMVGLHTPADPPTTAPTDAVVVHAGTGVTIRLGGPDADEPTINADTWQSGMDDVIDAIATALSGIAPGAGTPVTVAWTAFKATAYKSGKVRVK